MNKLELDSGSEAVIRGAHVNWVRSALAVAMLMLVSQEANAAATAGDVFCNVFKNAGGLPFFVSALAYLAGGAIFMRGVYDLIKRSSDPNVPLKNGLLGIFVGSGIVSMPYLVQWLHRTLYKSVDSYSANFGCVAGAAQNPGAPIPLDEMMANFVSNIFQPIVALVGLMAVVFGAFMIFNNMIKLSKLGTDGKAQSLTPILTALALGALLMAVGQTLNTSLTTLFGGDAITKYKTIAYDPGGTWDKERFDRAMTAVFAFLYIVGLISFVRGFFILKNAMEGSGQQTKGQAFTHIIGGTLLVNMPGFIEVIEKTTGIDIIKS